MKVRLLEQPQGANRKGVSAMRRAADRAREEWGDAERRIRQRMRIYPRETRKPTVEPEPEMEADTVDQGIPAGIGEPEPNLRKPIVSIHGKDIDQDAMTGTFSDLAE
ncbi:MAG TPA: hypothetical protein VKZ53_05980 [Candidatus Angelobacter sp.]|nr:hypothetical protein [Candidatus Angelobacter sp.]